MPLRTGRSSQPERANIPMRQGAQPSLTAPPWALPPTMPGTVATSRESKTAGPARQDRKSTRLNSSHRCISYAVFCLKKKKMLIKDAIVRRQSHSRSLALRLGGEIRFFFFNDTATTEIYTLSLHDALPTSGQLA